MSVEDSVTVWIQRLQSGDEAAAEQLWQRYFQRLVVLAGKKLPRGVRRDFDEEDVALSAFYSLCEGVSKGRFPRLDDRNNLWTLLVVLTARKSMRRLRRATAKKRGGGVVRGESVLDERCGERIGIDQVIGSEPSAAFAAEVAEESERLLALLPDEAMRRLAVLKMEGLSNKEAAAELDCGLRTVERRLALIRSIWSDNCDPVG